MPNGFRSSFFKPDRETRAALKRGAAKTRGAYKRISSGQPKVKRKRPALDDLYTEWLPLDQYLHLRSIKHE